MTTTLGRTITALAIAALVTPTVAAAQINFEKRGFWVLVRHSCACETFKRVVATPKGTLALTQPALPSSLCSACSLQRHQFNELD